MKITLNPDQEVVKALMAAGAKTDKTDARGRTAIDLASDNKIKALLAR